MQGIRVRLSPLTDEDSPTFLKWINEREQVLLSTPYLPVSEAEHRLWFESVQGRKDTFIFAIRTIEEDRLIGSCQLHSVHWVHRTAELQIRIGEADQRGQGYGQEITKLLLDFAFLDLNLNRVSLHVFEGNEAAIHVYKKTGFRREGLLRQGAHINGEYLDILVMGILREEHVSQDSRGHSPA